MADTDDDVVDDLIDEEVEADEEDVPVRVISDPDSRRRVEQKLEELRLRRMTQDYDFDLD
jgi:hypothetical protein